MRGLLSIVAGDALFVIPVPGFATAFELLLVDVGIDGTRLMLDTAGALHCATEMRLSYMLHKIRTSSMIALSMVSFHLWFYCMMVAS